MIDAGIDLVVAGIVAEDNVAELGLSASRPINIWADAFAPQPDAWDAAKMGER